MADEQCWQLNKSLAQTNAHLLTTGLGSDVSFRLGADHGQEETVRAHKLILASRSPVFEAMFYGSLPETGGVICIPDVHPAAFKLLLEFMYTESCPLVKISPMSVEMDVAVYTVYAARKYMVPSLVTAAVGYIVGNLNDKNVCHVYELCIALNETELIDTCKNEINQTIGGVMQSDSFLQLTEATMTAMLKDENLVWMERDLLDGVIRYAKRKADEGGDSNDMKKTIKRLCQYIRIPIVPYRDLVTLNQDFNFISDSDMHMIYKYQQGLISSENIPFSCSFRNYHVWKRMSLQGEFNLHQIKKEPCKGRTKFTLDVQVYDGWSGYIVALSLFCGPYFVHIFAFNADGDLLSVTERDFTQLPLEKCCRETDIMLSTPVKLMVGEAATRIEVHLSESEYVYMYNDSCHERRDFPDDEIRVQENKGLQSRVIIVSKVHFVRASASTCASTPDND